MAGKRNSDQDDMDNFHFDDGEDEKSDQELLGEWITEGDEDDEPKKAVAEDEVLPPADADEVKPVEDEDWDEDDEDEDEAWDEDDEESSEDDES